MIARFKTDKAGFAGDWHGNTRWAVSCLNAFADNMMNIVYQVGDFGVWGGLEGTEYRKAIQETLHVLRQTLVVIPGNHENYDLIESWPINEFGFIVEPENYLIWYAPRGHVWLHNDTRFAALGGAFSIDVGMRKAGKSWWPQEEIKYADVLALQANMDANDWWAVDVLLTHDIPAGCSVGQKRFQLPVDLENESYRQRMILREGVDIAKPQTIVHGHWHKYLVNVINGVSPDGFDYRADVIGLAEDGNYNNVMIANIDNIIGLDDMKIISYQS